MAHEASGWCNLKLEVLEIVLSFPSHQCKVEQNGKYCWLEFVHTDQIDALHRWGCCRVLWGEFSWLGLRSNQVLRVLLGNLWRLDQHAPRARQMPVSDKRVHCISEASQELLSLGRGTSPPHTAAHKCGLPSLSPWVHSWSSSAGHINHQTQRKSLLQSPQFFWFEFPWVQPLCLFHSCSARPHGRCLLGQSGNVCYDFQAFAAASYGTASSRWLLPQFFACQLRETEHFSNITSLCSLSFH